MVSIDSELVKQKLYSYFRLYLSDDDLPLYNKALQHVEEIKANLADNSELYHAFRCTLTAFTLERFSEDVNSVHLKEIRESDLGRIKDTLQGGRDLIAELHAYLPPNWNQNVRADEEIRSLNEIPGNNESRKPVRGMKRKEFDGSEVDKAKNYIQEETLSFLAKVQDRLPVPTHDLLVEAVFIFGTGGMEKNVLEDTVEKMEKEHHTPGLLQELKSFLTQCEATAEELRERQRRRWTYDYLTNYFRQKSPRGKVDRSSRLKADTIEDELMIERVKSAKADLTIETVKSTTRCTKLVLKIEESEEKKRQRSRSKYQT